MQYDEIRVDDDDHVRLITLDRPARRNAMTWRMHAELSDAMASADQDDAVYVVVVTGAPPAFCAGSDMSAGDHTWEAPAGTTRRAGLEPYQVRKPVLAAINGHAIGMGLTYPLQCDIRFVAADAKLSFAFTRRGVAPELGSHYLLPRIVGFSNAADLLLSGRTFSGAGRRWARTGVARTRGRRSVAGHHGLRARGGDRMLTDRVRRGEGVAVVGARSRPRHHTTRRGEVVQLARDA